MTDHMWEMWLQGEEPPEQVGLVVALGRLARERAPLRATTLEVLASGEGEPIDDVDEAWGLSLAAAPPDPMLPARYAADGWVVRLAYDASGRAVARLLEGEGALQIEIDGVWWSLLPGQDTPWPGLERIPEVLRAQDHLGRVLSLVRRG